MFYNQETTPEVEGENTTPEEKVETPEGEDTKSTE